MPETIGGGEGDFSVGFTEFSRPEVAEQIYTASRTLGANTWEQNLLLGLAAVESNFDPEAIGDQDLPGGPSLGLFQVSPESGLSIGDQVEHAYGIVQRMVSQLNRIGALDDPSAPLPGKDKTLAHMLDGGSQMLMRYARAAWQLRDKDLRLDQWFNSVEAAFSATYDSLIPMPNIGASWRAEATHALLLGNPRWMLADDAQQSARNERWDVDDFIDWVAKHKGANAAALRRGQDRFGQWMIKFGWNPIRRWEERGALTGKYGETAPSDVFYDPDIDAYTQKPSPVVAGIRRFWRDVASGGKEFAKGAARTILPIAGVALTGAIGYILIKRILSDDRKKREAAS